MSAIFSMNRAGALLSSTVDARLTFWAAALSVYPLIVSPVYLIRDLRLRIESTTFGVLGQFRDAPRMILQRVERRRDPVRVAVPDRVGQPARLHVPGPPIPVKQPIQVRCGLSRRSNHITVVGRIPKLLQLVDELPGDRSPVAALSQRQQTWSATSEPG